MMKTSGYLLLLTLAFTGNPAEGAGCQTASYCPEGSCFFIAPIPAKDSCPNELPTFLNSDTSDELEVCNGNQPDIPYACGMCMKLGAEGAHPVEHLPGLTDTCEIKCDENGKPTCDFYYTEESEDTDRRRKRRPRVKIDIWIGNWHIHIGRDPDRELSF